MLQKNDILWMKIKALNIAFKPLCCKCTQKVVNMWILLGFWGQRSSPVQTVQGLWHLTTCFSQLYSLYSKETQQKGLLQSDELKSMIKHFHRHKRQPVVFSHVRKQNKTKQTKTATCWPYSSHLWLPERRSPWK